MKINEIISKRNKVWKHKEEIPSWVNLDEVGLDQFFTSSEVAKTYYKKMCDFLKSKNIKLKDCLFIEPSAGKGAFFNLLPKNQRIGIDIYSLDNEIIEMDFLSWTPPKTDKKIIFIGNPPFGYRAWLALAFLNHASKFADYVFFILPMSFQSEAKGSPKSRVKNLKLVFSEVIKENAFRTLEDKKVKVNALWQCWEKGINENLIIDDMKEFVDIFTVDQREERLCGHKKIDKADFFIQRTFYNDPPSLVKNFSEVKYVCGYGVILKKNKTKILNILKKIDWVKYSNLTTHNCRHISIYHIKKALIEGGIK